jgi:hypothetical protein
VKRDRTHLVGAREPQPITSFLCGQRGQRVSGDGAAALEAPIFGSSPFSSR